ncbi:hypothetical protein ACN93_21070 [Gordonia paraffinivorans]|nr:hypothetical protein ACN93_21070 [Gordonia paraffinivorans]
MQFKHAPVAVSAVFDDPNLVSVAGLVPMLRLARSAGLDELAQSRLSVPTAKASGAPPPAKPQQAGDRDTRLTQCQLPPTSAAAASCGGVRWPPGCGRGSELRR